MTPPRRETKERDDLKKDRVKGGNETESQSPSTTVPFDDGINQQAHIDDPSRGLNAG